ncbi:hypothetical protein AAF712_010129 [Marasmius tenuissimus]|uniref:Uncharacterized protein n=1 Tax=Marasmius tenuissimus TaxID=585030 RepID=A0ABR2ZNS0_9AGAR
MSDCKRKNGSSKSQGQPEKKARASNIGERSPPDLDPRETSSLPPNEGPGGNGKLDCVPMDVDGLSTDLLAPPKQLQTRSGTSKKTIPPRDPLPKWSTCNQNPHQFVAPQTCCTSEQVAADEQRKEEEEEEAQQKQIAQRKELATMFINEAAARTREEVSMPDVHPSSPVSILDENGMDPFKNFEPSEDDVDAPPPKRRVSNDFGSCSMTTLTLDPKFMG